MLRSAIAEAALARLADAIERAALPSILLHPSPTSEAACALGESKLGGRPDLPEGVLWPEFGGHPLAFLAQFDLAALAPFDTGKLLPEEGLLLFFVMDPYYETMARYEVTIFRVLHCGDSLPLRRREFPPALSSDGRYSPCQLSYSEQTTLISYSWHDPSSEHQSGFPLPLSEAEVDAYYALGEKLCIEAGGTSRIMHRLLGHPDEIQGSMRDDLPREPDDAEANYEHIDSSELAASRSPEYTFQPSPWHLLLQLDTDDATGMSWGDSGRLYFWIRDRDLQRRDFDRVVLLDQCS